MNSFIGRLRDLQRADRVLEAEVRDALVGTLYASTASLLVGAIAGSTVAAIVASKAMDPWITGCAGLMSLVAVTRVIAALIYHAAIKAGAPPAKRWEVVYGLGAWTYSALIGLLPLLALIRSADPVVHFVAAATAIGYAGGISGRNCSRPNIAMAQMSLAALPVAAGLLLHDDVLYRTLGVATIFYVLAMVEITFQLYGVVRQAIVTTHERRKAAEVLQVALTAAEEASIAKTAFLTTMSHEIRTPLNGVLGMAQALAAAGLSPDQAARVEVIRQSGESLLAVLNDVLDLAKVESGKFELDASTFDLGTLLSSVHASFRDVALGKGVQFDLLVESSAEGLYVGDPMRVRQICANLISNALKFTESGSVRIEARHDGEALRLTVSDTGIGIAPQHLDKIFERFSQADATTTRRFGGTGLGLALCKELAKSMGGDIAVRSELGAGSAFTADLRMTKLSAAEVASAAEAQPHAPAVPPAAAHDTGLRVLCADDNTVNRLVLQTLLDQMGVAYELVADGAEAVEAWKLAPFDLILMDVQMPVIDGMAATRAIRDLERPLGRPRTPIIALTANVMAHQTAEYLACGMDDVVAKPIVLADLMAAMERQLDATDQAQRVTA